MDTIEQRIKAIHDNLNHWMTPEVLKACLGMTDLTTLKTTDTYSSIRKLAGKVNDFQHRFPEYPLPASICVYPNFAKTVKETLTVQGVHTTVVAGCFPASQSFLEVKVLESRMAVEDGADEVDIVLSLNNFLDNNLSRCETEIRAVREVTEGRILKVILETGALADAQKIRSAFFPGNGIWSRFHKDFHRQDGACGYPVCCYYHVRLHQGVFQEDRTQNRFQAGRGHIHS